MTTRRVGASIPRTPVFHIKKYKPHAQTLGAVIRAEGPVNPVDPVRVVFAESAIVKVISGAGVDLAVAGVGALLTGSGVKVDLRPGKAPQKRDSVPHGRATFWRFCWEVGRGVQS